MKIASSKNHLKSTLKIRCKKLPDIRITKTVIAVIIYMKREKKYLLGVNEKRCTQETSLPCTKTI